MANHRGVKLCKAKGQYIAKTERQMYGCHEPYLNIFTHNLVLSGFFSASSSMPIAPAATPILFNLVFHYGLES